MNIWFNLVEKQRIIDEKIKEIKLLDFFSMDDVLCWWKMTISCLKKEKPEIFENICMPTTIYEMSCVLNKENKFESIKILVKLP